MSADVPFLDFRINPLMARLKAGQRVLVRFGGGMETPDEQWCRVTKIEREDNFHAENERDFTTFPGTHNAELHRAGMDLIVHHSELVKIEE